MHMHERVGATRHAPRRSGPKRFYLDASSRRWRNTRDNADMLEMLAAELKRLVGATVEFERRVSR